jgi:hypothetical protein
MPSLRCATHDPRPRLREKDPPALSAQQNSLLNMPRLLPAHLPKPLERRAPKLLHVGRRISVIQGRRAGEWLGQHRSVSAGRDMKLQHTAVTWCHCVDLVLRGGRRAQPRPCAIRDRLAGRTPRSERGDRGSNPCPGANTWASNSAWPECLSNTQDVAGSNPASPIPRGRSSAR